MYNNSTKESSYSFYRMLVKFNQSNNKNQTKKLSKYTFLRNNSRRNLVPGPPKIMKLLEQEIF